MPQRPQRKQRGMLEQPGSVVGRGDDPAGLKKASSERSKPEKQAKNRQNRPQNADFWARRGRNCEMHEKHEKRTILPQSLPSRRHGPPRGAERSENGFLARHFRKNSVGRDSKGGNFVLGKMGGVGQSLQNMRRIKRPIAAKPKNAQKSGFWDRKRPKPPWWRPKTGPEEAETTKCTKNAKKRTILPQRPPRGGREARKRDL